MEQKGIREEGKRWIWERGNADLDWKGPIYACCRSHCALHGSNCTTCCALFLRLDKRPRSWRSVNCDEHKWFWCNLRACNYLVNQSAGKTKSHLLYLLPSSAVSLASRVKNVSISLFASVIRVVMGTTWTACLHGTREKHDWTLDTMWLYSDAVIRWPFSITYHTSNHVLCRRIC